MIGLMGLPGSGKSTQGKKLAEKIGGVWLSAGQVLRGAGEFEEEISSGDLVEDSAVIEVMKKKIEEIKADGKEIILDGFPRTLAQAEWLVESSPVKLDFVLIIEVDREELLIRKQLRGRADDTQATFVKRLAITEQNMCSILELLGDNGVTIEKVNGMGTEEEVEDRVLSTCGEMNKKFVQYIK